MGLLSPSDKYKFDGIGSASAAAVMAVLAAEPATAWLTVGIPGKITSAILRMFFSSLASKGVVILNVGAEKLMVALEKSGFDGSIESSYKLIEEIRASGRDLTPEEIKAIDDKVIEQFRKFAKLTRGKK